MGFSFVHIKNLFSCCKSININVTMASTRVRAFCFTWNNPRPDAEQLLESLPGYTYLTFGRETGAGGTPHLQGFIRFEHAKSFRAARTILRGAHVEIARTITAAIQYCHKDGDFVEFGTRPQSDEDRGHNEHERWEKAWQLAKEGRYEEINPDIRLKYYPAICRIKKDYMAPAGSIQAPCGIWIYGESGVGKTSSVYATYPALYSKNASKWWDGYQDQDVVLFDDMDPDCGKWAARFFKIWADERPFIADIKGGSVSIRPKKFIVTSQYSIEECFGEVQTRMALRRRFTVITKHSLDDIINF